MSSCESDKQAAGEAAARRQPTKRVLGSGYGRIATEEVAQTRRHAALVLEMRLEKAMHGKHLLARAFSSPPAPCTTSRLYPLPELPRLLTRANP